MLYEGIYKGGVSADTAFEAAAQAAFMTTNTLSPVFNPYANDVFFLHGELLVFLKHLARHEQADSVHTALRGLWSCY